jgi:small-conductance mechanosensitive channel
VVRLARTVVSLIGLAIAMTWFGVDVRWFTVVLVFSAVVTFLVLRPLVENFSAGLLLETRSAFTVGDEIETKGHAGEVLEVNGRTTVLRTRDGRRIHIPSTSVLASVITVYTAFEGRRSSIELGIDDGVDLDRVVDVLADAIADVDGVHGNPKPSVRASGLGNGTVLIELHWWHGARLSEESQTYDKVVRKLKETISAEGIVMPPPQLLVNRLDDV